MKKKSNYKRIFLGIVPWLIFQARSFFVDYKRNILLITVGRGGSTWLSQMFSNHRSIPLFEPFSDLVLSGKFDKPFYSRDERQRDWLKDEFVRRFKGKNLPISAFVDVSISQALFGSTLIFKTVNLQFELELLISSHFEVSTRVPIALNRHPMPVIMSELNIKGELSYSDSEMNYVEKLRLSENHPLRSYASRNWIYENTYFLRFVELLIRYKKVISYTKNPLIILDYENIRSNPKIIIDIAEEYFGYTINNSIIWRKSRSTLKGKKKDWNSIFNESDLEKFKELLSLTEMDQYYNLKSESAIQHIGLNNSLK